MPSRKLTTPLLVAALLTLSAVASAASFNKSTTQPGQSKDTLSGKYEGVAKSDQLGEIPLKVEIKNDNGKLTGTLESPQGPAALSGTLDNGKIVLKFDAGGNAGTVTAMLEGDKITGKWEVVGIGGGGLELKRAAMVASAPAAAPAATAGDPLSGEWVCSADNNGTAIPFTLKIKLDGGKVTGTSEGEQGATPITAGSFSEGKLSFSLDVGGTEVKMVGMVKEGKVTGDYDFGGQASGKWEGKKK